MKDKLIELLSQNHKITDEYAFVETVWEMPIKMFSFKIDDYYMIQSTDYEDEKVLFISSKNLGDIKIVYKDEFKDNKEYLEEIVEIIENTIKLYKQLDKFGGICFC